MSPGDIGGSVCKGQGTIAPGVFFPLPQEVPVEGLRALLKMCSTLVPSGGKGGCQASYIWKCAREVYMQSD
jgi:hypothetical protein